MAEYMEPERKIEKLLRAYAKKRRADAGEPLKLPPLTRRLLHDEIGRRAAKPEPDDSISLWQLLREQWVFLFGFALIMFCLATLFLPKLGMAKHKAQNITAMNNLKQIGLAAQMVAANTSGRLPASLEDLSNVVGSSSVLIDPQSGKPFIYAAAGENLDTLKTDAVLAYSPVDKNGRAVLLADGRVEYANSQRFFELTNQPPVELAMAKDATRELAQDRGDTSAVEAFKKQSEIPKLPAGAVGGELTASAPMAAPPAPTTDNIQFGARASQPLSPAKAGGLQNLFKNNAHSTKTTPVLVNFQMEQDGNNLRVIDGDGSVYEGPWQPSKAIAQNVTAQAENNANSGLPAQTPAQNSDQTFSSNTRQQLVAQNYLFQVSGTNLTSKQNVVFSGNLTIVSGGQSALPPAAANSQSVNAQLQNAADYPQLIWSNVRVVGTAVVAGTNQIDVNATAP